MNSGLQLLRSVPELKELVINGSIANGNGQQQPNQLLINSLKGIWKELNNQDVTPKMFVAMFLQLNPEFQPFGTQQDSE